MGLNVTCLELMTLARASGADFSRVATIGRQGLHIAPDQLARFFAARGRADLAERMSSVEWDGYCEPLLKFAFGAREVVSIDASSYERASIVHDMNKPLADGEQFTAVLDFGTLEHVLNVATSFDNVAKLCARGGFILHVLPGNNFSGHGFYQFSPELFFQIYAEARGYAGTRVFAAPSGRPDMWYEVRSPKEVGARVDITSRDQLHLLVLTQKVGEARPLAEEPVQQSDYSALWEKEGERKAPAQRRQGAFEAFIKAASTQLRHRRKVSRRDIERPRADITPRRVAELTARFEAAGA
jgi:hypothetical protein